MAGSDETSRPDYSALKRRVQEWGRDLGFQRVGVTGVDLSADEGRYEQWLAEGRHGEMDYMARHGRKRTRPAELKPGTVRIISVRMDYYPEDAPDTCDRAWDVLGDSGKGYVSRYALGRDYHKVMRKRLQKLADRIESEAGPFGYRAFVDSAPVLEKPLARNAGLGWIGKHTNLLSRESSTPTCRCPRMSRAPTTAAPAGVASTPAPPAPSPGPTGSTPDCAFRI